MNSTQFRDLPDSQWFDSHVMKAKENVLKSGWVIPYIGYIDMRGAKGYGFLLFW